MRSEKWFQTSLTPDGTGFDGSIKKTAGPMIAKVPRLPRSLQRLDLSTAKHRANE